MTTKHYNEAKEDGLKDNLILSVLKKKGWSQGDLSRASGIDRVHINHIIHRKGSPLVGTAIKIARALGVPVETLWPPE